MIAELRIENQMLKDEIARLKKISLRPKIPPGKLDKPEDDPKGGGSGKPSRGKHSRKKKTGLVFHKIQKLKPDAIPEGAVFKGTRKYDVQDILCQAYNTRYEIERWLLPDGTYTDEVGTRHCSKNCYTNVICNEFFVYLTTTNSKNRINFLTILVQGRKEYRFNQDAYDYLASYKEAEWLIAALKLRNDPVFYTEDPEATFLGEFGHLNQTAIRVLTEAGLFASLIEHGVPRDLNIHSDDAAQFEIFKQSLCWIHEERHYRKLIPSHPELAAEIEKIRAAIWQLYQDLKAYKKSPSKLAKKQISDAFDALFNPTEPTPYSVLNNRLSLTYAKKDRLLFVLERPETPLHNNSSETGGRGAKVKSKISGGTRSEEGRRAWDTFGSLNLTCRRLGINFYDYLMDRFLKLNKIANLGDIIRARTKTAKTPASPFNEAFEDLLNAS